MKRFPLGDQPSFHSMTHLLKSSKSVFVTVLLGFHVQLFIAPTFSFANENGTEIIQKPQEESEVVKPINPEEELEKLERQFEEKIEETLTNAQEDVDQIDKFLKEAKEDAREIKETLTNAQEDAEKIKGTLTKPVEDIKETLAATQTKADETREDIDDLVPKVSEIQDTIQGFYGFIALLSVVSILLGCLVKFLWDSRHPILNWVSNFLRLENRMNQKIDENRKELEDKIKDLESKVSKMQGDIKSNGVSIFILGPIVMITLFSQIIVLPFLIVKTLNPTESSLEPIESNTNRRIDESYKKKFHE